MSDFSEYELIQEKMYGEIPHPHKKIYYVVDFPDDFIYFTGTKQECNKVLTEAYGGLMIVDYDQLTPKMRELAEPF